MRARLGERINASANWASYRPFSPSVTLEIFGDAFLSACHVPNTGRMSKVDFSSTYAASGARRVGLSSCFMGLKSHYATLVPYRGETELLRAAAPASQESEIDQSSGGHHGREQKADPAW